MCIKNNLILKVNLFVIPSILFLSCLSSLAQDSRKPQDARKKIADSATSVNEAFAEKQLRLHNLMRAKDVAEVFSSYKSVWIKATATAELANLLWIDDNDHSRLLFDKAINFVGAANNGLKGQLKTSLCSQVSSIAGRRDKKLGDKLIKNCFTDDDDNLNKDERSQAYGEAANSMVKEDGKNAVYFAEKSLENGVSSWIVSTIKQLRETDPSNADRLFLQTVNQIKASSRVDINTLMYLGTYVFTSPRLPANERLAVSMQSVGGFLIYDLSQDRLDIPAALPRAYLFATAAVLNRPVSNPQDQRIYSLIAQMMLPKAIKFAPETIGQFAAISRGQSDTALSNVNRAGSGDTSQTTPGSIDEEIKNIEKEPTQDARDMKFLLLTHKLWSAKEFNNARKAGDKISDLNISSRLKNLIDFGVARVFLEKGNVVKAAQIAVKLPKNVESAILWLGIANAHIQSGRKPEAEESLNEAIGVIRSLSDIRSSYLNLIAADMLAQINSQQSYWILSEAVRQFNNSDDTKLQRIKWSEAIEVGMISRVFPLNVKGLNYDFRKNFRFLFGVDIDGTELAIKQIKSEKQQSEGLLGFAEVVLKNKNIFNPKK